jgi:hypothetical protein
MSKTSRAKRKQRRHKTEETVAPVRSTKVLAKESPSAPLMARREAAPSTTTLASSDEEIFSALELEFFRRGDEPPVSLNADDWLEDFERDGQSTGRFKTGLA